jgi:hypothetical protein
MSAIGPKLTSLVAVHMSAFGGKADIFAFSIVDLAPPARIALGGFIV